MATTTDWARVIGTTIVNHLREEELTTFRRFKVFAALEGSGNVVMNQGGRGFDWEVRYRNTPVVGNTGENPRTFARQNLWKRAELNYRGYVSTDSIFKREMLENRGREALVNVASKMASRLQESMEQHLSAEVYVDGNETGNENRFHGIESFMGQLSVAGTAQGINPSTGAIANMAASMPFAAPGDTYAGLSTALGYYGGSQGANSAWPNGKADPEYDFYSPVLVNWSSSYWTNNAGLNPTLTAWGANCVAATREGIHQCKRNDTRESAIDMVLLDRKLYIGYLNALDSKERAIVTRENGLRSYGFSDVFEQDGVEISTEYAIPQNTGYGISIGNMELRCMESTLMVPEGPFYNEELQSYRYAVSVLANLKFKSPRNFFKLFNYA
jgi:hypothetical protein